MADDTGDEPFDVCILGSGAGGGAAAYTLTKAGLRVVMLEKGAHYRTEDFFHDEIAVCRRNYFVPSVFEEPRMIARDGGVVQPSSDAWISCCVGGGTVHMSGFFFRMRDDDFRMKTRLGAVEGASVADWPIAAAELAPHYDEVERVIGVSGDHVAEGRRAPYPLGPIATHPSGALIDDACKKLGFHSFQCGRAIISAPYDGRLACHHCGFCGSYGCEVAAKSSTLVTFIARATATGKLTLIPRAMVSRLVAGANGRLESATYFDDQGVEQRVRAKAFVVACSAIETARLLLGSGVANESGQVGKHLMFATYASASARFTLPSPHFPSGPPFLPFIDRCVQDFYGEAGTLLFLLPHKNPIFQAERVARGGGDAPIFGAALKAKMREYFLDTRSIDFEAFGSFLPHDGCDVTLDPTVKDRFGLPVARVRVATHVASRAGSDFLSTKGRAVLDAAGAKQIVDVDDERTYLVLQAGTARMGRDESSSVLDQTGRAHHIKNLYVADSSGFPSVPGAPWTLTIMANALRVATHLVARGKRGEL